MSTLKWRIYRHSDSRVFYVFFLSDAAALLSIKTERQPGFLIEIGVDLLPAIVARRKIILRVIDKWSD